MNSLTVEKSAFYIKNTIEDAIESKRGCLIGRWGTIEFEMVWFGHAERRFVLERNAGVFPCQKQIDVESWREEYVNAIQNTDVLATGWYAPIKQAEQKLIDYVQWKGKQILLRGIEPYYVSPEHRWTTLLQNKRVCVVSSFTDSAKKQIAKGSQAIWGVKGIQCGHREWNGVGYKQAMRLS